MLKITELQKQTYANHITHLVAQSVHVLGDRCPMAEAIRNGYTIAPELIVVRVDPKEVIYDFYVLKDGIKAKRREVHRLAGHQMADAITLFVIERFNQIIFGSRVSDAAYMGIEGGEVDGEHYTHMDENGNYKNPLREFIERNLTEKAIN